MRTITRTIATLVSGAFLAATLAVAPAAEAKAPHKYGFTDSKGRYHAYETRAQCERARQKASNNGAIVGGLSGAVIGGAVSGKGAKTEGAAIGALAGVLTGRQVAKKDHRC